MYNAIDEVPDDYLQHMESWEMSDQQKVEYINTLEQFAQCYMDRVFGVGKYASPDHNPKQWLDEQITRIEAQRKKTPEELYQEGYEDWMSRYGDYLKKTVGAEKAEEECRQHAERCVYKELETRKRWEEYKASQK